MKFTSILRKVILEQSRFELLHDALTKPTVNKEGKKVKPKLSKEEFDTLVQADPTTRLNNVDLANASKDDMARVKAGSYVNWLIKSYLNVVPAEVEVGDREYESELKRAKELFIEDLFKVTNDLRKFDRFKGRLPQDQRDINKFTPDTLYDAVKDFSLEKTKASKEEKVAASKTYEHPGGEIVFRGPKWTVVKITDTGKLGKDAACFYGGYYLEPIKGETRWCTSSPGLDWFTRYINKGPLYVIIPNTSPDNRFGEKSGLPAKRYQFHFPDNQFMDEYDNQQDLVALLNGPMSELKNYFKPEFAKGLTTGDGQIFTVNNFSHGVIGKFISLYGLDDLMDSLPDSLVELQISDKDKKYKIKIPESIGRLKNLEMLALDGFVDKLPDSICELKKLNFLSLMDNPNLKQLPECLSNLPNLWFLNLKNSPNVQVPKFVEEKGANMGNGMWQFAQDDF